MPDTPRCGLPHYTHPETVCTEPPGHYRPDVDPHAGPLVIDGRHCGGAAWDEPETPPEPLMPDTTPTTPACVWPDCLTEPQHAELQAQVTAEEKGQPLPPMPDQRQTCGCTEAHGAARRHSCPNCDHPETAVPEAETLRGGRRLPKPTPAPAPVDPALQQRVARAVRDATTHIADLRNFDTQIAAAVLAELAPVPASALVQRVERALRDWLDSDDDDTYGRGAAIVLAELAPELARAHRAEQAEQRADAMTRAMESTAADALAHGGCHRKLMAQCLRAEQAEAALARVRDLADRWDRDAPPPGNRPLTELRAALTQPTAPEVAP